MKGTGWWHYGIALYSMEYHGCAISGLGMPEITGNEPNLPSAGQQRGGAGSVVAPNSLERLTTAAIKRRHGVPTVPLRVIECCIRTSKQIVKRPFRRFAMSHAEASCDNMSVAEPAVLNTEGFYRRPRPLRYRVCLVAAGIGHQHEDFLATKAERFARTGHLAQNALADGADTVVAFDMAMNIVEELETVDIKHDHRDRTNGTFFAPDGIANPRQRMAIEKTGQLIAFRFAF